MVMAVTVDKEKVPALEDRRVVIGAVVEEEALTEAEVEGGAEVEDVVEPVGGGDVAMYVLLKPLTSNGAAQLQILL